MAMVVALAMASFPVAVAAGIDALETQASTNRLILLVGALLLTAVIRYIANWIRRLLMTHLTADLIAQMRKDALAAATLRDMAFYD